jgi:hypothetical protein
MADTCIWTDLLGNKYTYSIYTMAASWNDVDGNYIFTSIQDGVWVPLYMGQGNFKTRMTAQHECWAPAMRLGATHVHAHTHKNSVTRLE